MIREQKLLQIVNGFCFHFDTALGRIMCYTLGTGKGECKMKDSVYRRIIPDGN